MNSRNHSGVYLGSIPKKLPENITKPLFCEQVWGPVWAKEMSTSFFQNQACQANLSYSGA